MSKIAPTRRKYDSSRRKARALETEHQMVLAARDLFVERGYVGTTIEQIAQRAGVAVETVYSTFGSKREILARLVKVSIVGDQSPVPLLERPGPQAVRQERDQRRQIALFARDMRDIMSRMGPIFMIMHTAAETEPDIATLLRTMLNDRLDGMAYFVRCLLANGPLSNQMSVEDAAETVWAVTSGELHQLLTLYRGWSGDRYETWLRDTLTRLLLDQ